MFLTRWLFAAILTLSTFNSAWAQWQEKLILTTHNLCPYGCYQNKHSDNSSSEHNTKRTFEGIAVSVVDCALNAINQPYEIVVLPWARAQKMVKDGQADGFFSASKQAKRDEYAVFSEVIAEQKWQWYMLKKNPLSPTQADFKQKALVGGFIGANMLSWLEGNNYQIAAKVTNSNVLLELLLKERVDAILANNNVMDALVKNKKIDGKIKRIVNKDKPLAVYFSNEFVAKHPSFLAAFIQHVVACRQTL